MRGQGLFQLNRNERNNNTAIKLLLLVTPHLTRIGNTFLLSKHFFENLVKRDQDVAV